MKAGDLVRFTNPPLLGIVLGRRPMLGAYMDTVGGELHHLVEVMWFSDPPSWMPGTGRIRECTESVLEVVQTSPPAG